MITLAASLMVLTAFAQDCSISPAAEAKLLAAPYAEFDQAMGNGWRTYGDRGCYALSASLLDRYFTLHRDTMLDWQIRVVVWHAGQMYAFNNDYVNARARFQNSFNPAEPANTPILWNDYVHATLAFLDKDLVKLKVHREAIAKGPEFNGAKVNLAIVDSLIRCFDRPYAIAYSGCRQ